MSRVEVELEEVPGELASELQAILREELPTLPSGPRLDAREDAARVELSVPELRAGRYAPLERDREVHAAEDAGRPIRLVVRGIVSTRDALHVLELFTRYQRLFLRRNAASSTPLFDRVLSRHRAEHPLEKPLVRADYDHALDAWQWVLRLDASAGLEVQLAALFHDVERLDTESDARVEHRALDHLAFKRAHALGSAVKTRRLLEGLGLGRESLERVCRLVEAHERPDQDAELELLNDADALSFFFLNSAGYRAYFGARRWVEKQRYTLDRMSDAAKRRLPLERRQA